MSNISLDKKKLEDDKTMYKKQKNYVSRLYKRERKKFFKNLDTRKLIDNKLLWKIVKPLFSDKGISSDKITLIKDDNIISTDEEVAKTFSTFFQNAVSTLDINENRYLLSSTTGIEDPIDIVIEKFKVHPSILLIKENVKCTDTFEFTKIDATDVELEIKRLNHKKANVFNGIPSKLLKENCDICCQPLHKMINCCIEDSVFPDQLKLGDMTPIFKKIDRTNEKTTETLVYCRYALNVVKE